jgi:hypothetical protein
MIEVIDLSAKFGLFSEHWRPRIVGELNDYASPAKGEFVGIDMIARTRCSRIQPAYHQNARMGPDDKQAIVAPKGTDHFPSRDIMSSSC